jgi:hypothetical protein
MYSVFETALESLKDIEVIASIGRTINVLKKN